MLTCFGEMPKLTQDEVRLLMLIVPQVKKSDPDWQEYAIPVHELTKNWSFDIDNTFSQIMAVGRGLRQKEFSKVVIKDDSTTFLFDGFISSFRYEEAQDFAYIRIDPEIRQHLKYIKEIYSN